MKVGFAALIFVLHKVYCFALTPISPPTDQDPFLKQFSNYKKLLPSLMVYPSPSGKSFDLPTASFQFNTTSSPLIAVNPYESGGMIAAMNQDPCWQSDLASTFDDKSFGINNQEIAIATSSDQGATWSTMNIPLNISLGGEVSNGFQLASLGIAGSQKGIYMAGRFADVAGGWLNPDMHLKHVVPLSGIWVANSQDGQEWTTQIISHQNSDAGMLFGTSDGFPSLACDPQQSNSAFIAWNRIGHTFKERPFGSYMEMGYLPTSGNIYFSKTLDQSNTWSNPKMIYNTERSLGKHARAAGVSLLATSQAPSGPLLIASFMRYMPNAKKSDRVTIRSTDNGSSWDRSANVVSPFVVAQSYNPSRKFPKLPNFPPFDGSERSCLALNPSTGTLYLLWQAGSLEAKSRESAKRHPEMVVSLSQDYGQTWSTPVAVSQTYQALLEADQNPFATHAYQAFNGNIAIMQNNLVGIAYYDCRNYQDGSKVASTDAWLAVYREVNGAQNGVGLEFVGEYRLTPSSFDQNLFGDSTTASIGIGYQLGITCSDNAFITAFAQPGIKADPLPIQEGHRMGFLYKAAVDTSQQLTCFMQSVTIP